MGNRIVRMATREELGLVRFALRQLMSERLVVSLAPAPDPRFEGHMIRVVECRNPSWYRHFYLSRRWKVKRGRVERALRRTLETGRIRTGGYEVELVRLFKELRFEYTCRKSANV